MLPNPIMEQEQMLKYVESIDPERKELLLRQICQLKNDLNEFLAEMKANEMLRSACVELFRKTGKEAVFFSEDICQAVFTAEEKYTISGRFRVVSKGCFSYCPGLKELTFGDGVEFVSGSACQGLEDLRSVGFSKSVRGIDEYAFADCISLQSVDFEGQDTYVRADSFCNTPWFDGKQEEFVVVCGQLLKYNGTAEEVRIPETVRMIQHMVFSGNSSIKKVVFPATLREIGVAAFSECTALESIEFQGKSIDCINMSAFEGCSSLHMVSLPDKVGQLGAMAFDRFVWIWYTTGCGIDDYLEENYPFCSDEDFPEIEDEDE